MRRVVQAVLSLGLGVAVLVFVLPQIADLSKVWAEIRDMTTLELAVLVLVSVWNLATYWILTVICTPGLRLAAGDGRHRDDDRGVEHGARGRRGGGRALLRDARVVGVLEVADQRVGDRVGHLEQLRQARDADRRASRSWRSRAARAAGASSRRASASVRSSPRS